MLMGEPSEIFLIFLLYGSSLFTFFPLISVGLEGGESLFKSTPCLNSNDSGIKTFGGNQRGDGFFDPPKLEILSEFRSHVLSTDSSVLLDKKDFKGIQSEDVSLHFICRAPYPFEFIFEANEKKLVSS